MRNSVRRDPRTRLLRAVGCFAPFLLVIPLCAQNDSLSLASGSASPGGSLALNLNLTSSATQPAAIQWTLTYNPASLANLSVSLGAASTAASKSVTCNSSSGSYTCLISGLNQTAIGNGVAAVVAITLSSGASGTVNIGVTNVSAAAPDGTSIPAAGSPGTVSVVQAGSLNSLSCSPATVNSGGTSSCTVTLAQPAPVGGAVVSLSSNNASLSIPASVTVASGATSASFNATAGIITTTQTATLTASYNGSTKTAAVSLIPPAVVSSVVCVPAILGSAATSSCTVTLSQAAPASGAAVPLSSNNALVTVPASITVSGGAITATFTATSGTVTTNQTATITAAYNGSSQTATISLVTQVLVSAISCAPASIGSGATTTCTVALSNAAPSAGAVVTLSSNNATLVVPPSVIIASGKTSANFTGTAGAIANNQSAILTATYNGSSQTAAVSLIVPGTVSSLVCAPLSLPSSTSATCTVTLSTAAPTGGAAVALASNNPLLTVPASITVAAGAAAATFSAVAGAIASNQSAVLTATYRGTSQSASISLTTSSGNPPGNPPTGGGYGTILAVNCSPAFVIAGSTATCVVTLTLPAPSQGVTALLSSDTPGFTVPAQVIIAAGAFSASFTAAAGPNTAGLTVTVMALNQPSGSFQTSMVTIVPPPVMSSVSCSPGSLTSNTSTICTITLAGPTISTGAAATLSTNTAMLGVPPTATFAGGTSSTTFVATAHTITAPVTAAITVTLNGNSQTALVALSTGPPQGPISNLTCSPDPASTTGALLCTVQLTSAAPSGGSNIPLQAFGTPVQLPAQVVVPAGAQSAQFRATVLLSDQDQQVNISAVLNGEISTFTSAIAGIRPTSLVCPNSLQAGALATCVVRLTATNLPAVARLTLAADSPGLKLPDSITTRPHQTRLTFVVASDPLAQQQSSTLSVQFGSTTVNTSLAIQQPGAPVLTLPEAQAVIPGSTITMTVSAADPGGLPVMLSVANLPSGATFNANSGAFNWTPAAVQLGTYDLVFTATNSASASATGHVTIYVDSGKPVITDVRNAASQARPACSPGSVASVVGRWLAAATQPVSDLSGQSLALAGAQVLVNGNAVPVLSASSHRVDFLCPAMPAGTPLAVSINNGGGTSDPAQATIQDISFGVFSTDGSGAGQGAISFAGTSLLATSRSYQNLGQPAQPSDAITIRVTGVGNAGPVLPMVKIGDLYARADALNAVPGMAGVYDITLTVPPGISDGQTVPINVIAPLPQSSGTCAPGIPAPGTWPAPPSGSCTSGPRQGSGASSNTVTAALELGF